MSITIPQIQDKVYRVCSNCRFKKVKCDGNSPCSTCLKDDKVCIVWVHLEDQRGTKVRQGCLNTYAMQSCMMQQALVDIIQKGVIPDVPTEALASPHKLLSALGVIDEKNNAAWKRNLEQPWAQTVFNAATTHPVDKTPHAPRGPNEPGKKKTPAVKKASAAAKKQRKQATRRPPGPTPPITPDRGFPVPGQYPGWHNAAAVAPAQYQLGYNNQPYIGQAYGPPTVESTFNSAPSSAAAFPSAPGHPYLPGDTYLPPASFSSSFPPTTGYGQLPAYAAPQPSQWQHQPAATPAPVPAMPAATAPAPVLPPDDFPILFPELAGSSGTDEAGGDLSRDGDGAAQEAPFTGPGEGVDSEDFEMGMDLIDWNALN